MATIKGDGIIMASGSSGSSTTQEFALPELQLNNFAVSEGIATFTLGTDMRTVPTTFCLFIKTSTASYLFSAVSSGTLSTNYIYYAMTSSSSGLVSSSTALACNSTTYQYAWNLTSSSATDADLNSGNFTVKAYSLIL